MRVVQRLTLIVSLLAAGTAVHAQMAGGSASGSASGSAVNSGAGAPPSGIGGALNTNAQNLKNVGNNTLDVPPGGQEALPFEAPKGGKFMFKITGLKNADKGFDCAVMTAAQWEATRAKKPLSQAPAFQELKVMGETKALSIPPGSYVIVIGNPYNSTQGLQVLVQANLT